MLHLIAFTQFRTQNRCALLLELLQKNTGESGAASGVGYVFTPLRTQMRFARSRLERFSW